MDHYTTERENEARELTSDRKQYRHLLPIIDLRPWSPEDYYDSLKDRQQFQRFTPPAKKHTNRSVGITRWLRLKSLFNQDAKKKLERLRQQADVLYQQEEQAAREHHNWRAESFYKAQEQQHKEVDRSHDKMRKRDSKQVESYFRFVMEQDEYTTDFARPHPINIEDVSYDGESRKLAFAYQLPLKNDILTFQAFQYDSTEDEIFPVAAPAKEQKIQRIMVARKILLRSIILIYESDTYGLIDNIEVTGFFRYYDPSYGNKRRKNVMKVSMSRPDYSETDFMQVDVEALFKHRLNATEVPDLYSKEPMELSDICTKEEKKDPPKRTRKPTSKK